MNFADRLKQLPSASHLAALHLLGADGQVLATLENKPGQAGSLAVYAALAALYGGHITPAAARLGQAIHHAGDLPRNLPSLLQAVDRYVERGAAVDQAHRLLEQRRQIHATAAALVSAKEDFEARSLSLRIRERRHNSFGGDQAFSLLRPGNHAIGAKLFHRPLIVAKLYKHRPGIFTQAGHRRGHARRM